MADEIITQHIGLLFVHGIGEQKRFEHLVNTVTQFAELMLQSEPEARVSVIDRTTDWKLPPGQPHPQGLAPISLTFRSRNKNIEYECYEVWWADLGARSGLFDQITFWLWGLGQWNAPIYRDLDASRLRKDKAKEYNKPVSPLTKLPQSVAGKILQEPRTRFELMLAGLSALFVGITWSLAKRVLASLLKQAPTPTLIVQYVGDVRTYEERAAPGNTSISDPGYPRRVGIRRRMVAEMTTVGTRPLHGWYVLAHSLGTVVAYNGLTEIGHALPNYLSEDQWEHLDLRYKRDDECERRKDVHAMMPARPHWLVEEDVINRPMLFDNLKGFLTYGSPLNKFSALWPRIVATATDRTGGTLFPNCRWVNLAAPHDPVGGMLRGFSAGSGNLPVGATPTLENRATPLDLAYLLAHIRYFAGVERCNLSGSATQKRAVMKWLLGETKIDIPTYPQNWVTRLLAINVVYGTFIVLLWLATACLVTMVGGVSLSFFAGERPPRFQTREAFIDAFLPTVGPVLGIALAIMLVFGLWRWAKESSLNGTLAEADKLSDSDKSRDKQASWDAVIVMLKMHAEAGFFMLTVFGATTILGIYFDVVSRAPIPEYPTGWLAAGISILGIISAAIVQTLINKTVPSLRRVT